ncbi:hypothetical protein ASE02_11425 [Phenylobacterium sp. Root700]|nr:hypothetical protein ASE02_11425 [Phenylobacterium sp. Root700]
MKGLNKDITKLAVGWIDAIIGNAADHDQAAFQMLTKLLNLAGRRNNEEAFEIIVGDLPVCLADDFVDEVILDVGGVASVCALPAPPRRHEPVFAGAVLNEARAAFGGDQE